MRRSICRSFGSHKQNNNIHFLMEIPSIEIRRCNQTTSYQTGIPPFSSSSSVLLLLLLVVVVVVVVVLLVVVFVVVALLVLVLF